MPDKIPPSHLSAPAHRQSLLRRCLMLPVTLLVLIYFLLQDLLLFFIRPLVRALAAFWVFIALAKWLRRLPPYAALLVFMVPFLGMEPVKILSLIWIAMGHVIGGSILLAVAYAASLLIVERVFFVTRDQLMTIGWFAACFELVMRVRDWAYQRLEGSWVWRVARPRVDEILARVSAGLAWLRARLRQAKPYNR